MRFVSRYGALMVVLRPQIQEAYATGMAKVIQEPIYANFSTYMLTPEERELALIHWSGWNGSYQHLDEATMVAPDYRIGVFDSDLGFADLDAETKAWAEEQLTVIGERSNDFFAVPRTLVPAPWPKYDEFSGSVPALMRKLVEEGHDLEKVLEYEQAMQNREKIVAALEELLSDDEALDALKVEEVVA